MKPLKIELAKLQGTLDNTFNLFICSSSFEERCLSIANSISVKNVSRALIFSNKDLPEHVGKNKDALANRFGEKGQVIETSLSDPLIIADIASCSDNPRVIK